MASIWGGLARAATQGATGYLAGDQQRRQRDEEQRRYETQQLVLQAARQQQSAREADATDRQKAQDALNGILTGSAPADPMALSGAMGGVAMPPRYEQVTPTRYVDETRTPEARAARTMQTQQAAALAAADRAERVRLFMQQQQEKAANDRLGVEHGYRLSEIDAQGAQRRTTAADALKPVPQSTMKVMIDNQRALSTADAAIAQVTAHPSAFGVTNAGPGAWVKDQLGASTADEQSARAAVADIGSTILHDRSGAAVTVSEMPRLAPFIPSKSDTPSVVRTKLQHLRDGIQQEHDLYVANFGPDQGYRAPDLSARRGSSDGSTAGPTPLQAKWDLAASHLRAQGKDPDKVIGARP